jgi:sec-independent protein translocase protein TatC
MAFSLFGRKKDGTEEKAEMSFIDHLEVLRGHLFRSVLAIAVGAIVFIVYDDFIVKKVLMGPTHADFPTYKWLCKFGQSVGLGDKMCMKEIGLKMQSTSVSGQFSMYFTMIFVGGIILSLYILGILAFCKTCAYKKRIIKNKRSDLLGIAFIFLWYFIRLFYYCSLYRKFFRHFSIR